MKNLLCTVFDPECNEQGIPLRPCCGNLRCDLGESNFLCPRDCPCFDTRDSCCRNADCTPFCQDKTTLRTGGQCLAIGSLCSYTTVNCKPNEEVCKDAACVEAHEFIEGQLRLLGLPFTGITKQVIISSSLLPQPVVISTILHLYRTEIPLPGTYIVTAEADGFIALGSPRIKEVGLDSVSILDFEFLPDPKVAWEKIGKPISCIVNCFADKGALAGAVCTGASITCYLIRHPPACLLAFLCAGSIGSSCGPECF